MRGRILDRDRMGIVKSWQMDMVPMKVWDDFQEAQQQLDAEANLLNYESSRHQFTYGKYAHNIFSFANELVESDKKRRDNYERVTKSGRLVIHSCFFKHHIM